MGADVLMLERAAVIGRRVAGGIRPSRDVELGVARVLRMRGAKRKQKGASGRRRDRETRRVGMECSSIRRSDSWYNQAVEHVG